VAVIYGVNPVIEQLAAGPEAIHHLYLLRGPMHGQIGRIAKAARENKIVTTFVDKKALNRLAEGGAHQGVVAETSDFRYVTLPEILGALSSPARLLVLDGVQDPHNLGAIVRTAVGAGADGLVIPKRNAASMTAAAVKASAGAAGKARIARVTNLVQALEQIKERGLWCVAVETRGDKDIRELDKTMDYCLVLGGEAQGIRRLLRERCDLTARIPMPGPLDSLNVSVAAGIVLFSILPEKGATTPPTKV
jgi:23S rRNA (guanosine2251-2'-O)-methyltransferase